MINGEKRSKDTLTKIKRLVDLLPEDKDLAKRPTLHDFLDLNITITKIDRYIDSRGKERGLNVTFTSKGTEYTLKITQTKLIDKLDIVKHQLPVVTKITQVNKRFDFA